MNFSMHTRNHKATLGELTFKFTAKLMLNFIDAKSWYVGLSKTFQTFISPSTVTFSSIFQHA